MSRHEGERRGAPGRGGGGASRGPARRWGLARRPLGRIIMAAPPPAGGGPAEPAAEGGLGGGGRRPGPALQCHGR